ncbi:MAG: ABC transporter ATP-binding protein, partial [Mesorhizobium sp.]
MKDGVIAHEERIDLERPRDVADPVFARIRGSLLDSLGVRHGTHGNA